MIKKNKIALKDESLYLFIIINITVGLINLAYGTWAYGDWKARFIGVQTIADSVEE